MMIAEENNDPKAFDVNIRMVDITNGKVTIQIDRY